MNSRYTLLGFAILVVSIMALGLGCSNDDTPAATAPPATYSYQIVLAGLHDPAGIFFSLADPDKAVESDGLEISISSDVSTLVEVDHKASLYSWEFMLLKKHGVLPRGAIGVITTDTPLESDFTIFEVCDAAGKLLETDEFALALVPID